MDTHGSGSCMSGSNRVELKVGTEGMEGESIKLSSQTWFCLYFYQRVLPTFRVGQPNCVPWLICQLTLDAVQVTPKIDHHDRLSTYCKELKFELDFKTQQNWNKNEVIDDYGVDKEDTKAERV